MKWNPIGSLLARFRGSPATSVSPDSEAKRVLGSMSIDYTSGPARSGGGSGGQIDLPNFLGGQGFARIGQGSPGMKLNPIVINTKGKTPQQVQDEIQDHVRRIIAEQGPGGIVPDQSALRAMPINPMTGEPLPHPDHLPWDQWVAMRERNARPGWTFCRMGAQTGDHICMTPFGIVREHFGVFWQTFHSCAVGDIIAHACLIHLKSGGGIGVFQDLRLACDAAESLMAQPDIDWNAIDPNDDETYAAIKPRMVEAFNFVGMHTAPWCVHLLPTATDPDLGPPIYPFVRNDDDKPKGPLS